MQISENRIVMRVPDNLHVHFRQPPVTEFLVPFWIEHGWIGKLVAEPNTLPAVLTGAQAVSYGEFIQGEFAKSKFANKDLRILVTIQITESTTPEMVQDAYNRGVRICKVYPKWVTTHSENGVENYNNIIPALAMAQSLGMIVQFHAEHPSYDHPGRLKEARFLMVFDFIRRVCPKLKISVEHVSSKEMVNWVIDQDDYVGAGVTVQHIYQTADDLNGYSKRSGGLCCVHDGAFKPGAKDPEDREAIREVILAGNKKFWYGGDDAFHPKSKKEAAKSCCGAWNTIAALSMIISFFEKAGELLRVEPFLSEFGANYYGLSQNVGTISIVRKKWAVEKEYSVPAINDFGVPFYAGEPMDWQIEDPAS